MIPIEEREIMTPFFSLIMVIKVEEHAMWAHLPYFHHLWELTNVEDRRMLFEIANDDLVFVIFVVYLEFE